MWGVVNAEAERARAKRAKDLLKNMSTNVLKEWVEERRTRRTERVLSKERQKLSFYMVKTVERRRAEEM